MKKVIFTLSLMLFFTASSWSQTQIQAADCGTTLTSMTQNIFADAVAGANRYEFTVSEGANTYVLERNSTAFRPSLIPSMLYGTTYSVSVRHSFDGGANWNGPGASCNITTMAAGALTTNIDDAIGTYDCGNTMTSFTQNLFATPIDNAAEYKFTFTGTSGVANGAVYTVTRNQNVVRGNLVPGMLYNTDYDITVEWIEADGTVHGPGSVCSTTAPTTSVILDPNCGTTLPTMATNIFSSQIPGAPHYRFKFHATGAGSGALTDIIVIRPNNWIRGNLVPGILHDQAYEIVTAIEVSPGVFGDYDITTCDITTPSLALANATTTQLTTADCAVGTLSSMSQNLFADAIVGAVQYRFKWTEVSTSTDFIVSRTTPVIRATLMSASYDETYLVSVEWQASDGTWSGYGSACTINTPTAAGLTTNVSAGDCSGTFADNNTIYADAILGATQYEFIFDGGTYSRIIGSNFVKPSQVIGLVDGTYSVTVKWKQANGTWSAAGSACNVTIDNGGPAFVLNDKPNVDNVLVEDKSIALNTAVDFEVSAYPNPTADQTILTATQAIQTIEVYTIAGKLVLTTQPNASQTSIDLFNFENGIYLVKVISNDVIKTMKVVKR